MYEEYLCRLLAPLGVYRLDKEALNRAELFALGRALDGVSAGLEEAERESLTATAEGEGLDRREALFLRRPAAFTPEDRRAAIAALLQIDGDSLTPAAINRAIRGCGIRARAVELGQNRLRVEFPGTVGPPPDFQQIQNIILDILPCHLGVEFFLRLLTWVECHGAGYTWAWISDRELDWDGLQKAVTPEAAD